MPISLPKTERNAAIVAALKADPYLTLEQVAQEHGLTRERVRQIWKRETGTKSARRRPPKNKDRVCPTCGQTYIGPARDHLAAARHGPAENQYLRNREWVALYNDGLSTVQIARIYGTGPQHVNEVLNRYGVELRSAHHKGMPLVRKRHVDALR